MKIAVITDSWPTKGTDSIYLNAAFKKEAYNLDLIIITTSKDGFGMVEGIHNIIEHRVESVPRREKKHFFDEACKVLTYEKPDVCITLAPSKYFLPAEYCKLNIAHWTSSTSSVDIHKDIANRYDIHTTFEEKHKLRLIALGVSEDNIFVMTPIAAHATILTILSKILKKDQEPNDIDSSHITTQLTPVKSDYICFIDKNITVTTVPWYQNVTDLEVNLEDIKWHETMLVSGLDLYENNIDVPEEYRARFFDLNENLDIRNIIHTSKHKDTIPVFAARVSR